MLCTEERQKDLQLLDAAADGGAAKASRMLVPKAQDADDDSDESESDDDDDSVRACYAPTFLLLPFCSYLVSTH